MIKILLGGSPCTYWSIAQKNGRETEAEGMGWELFKNYLIAKEKFKPDFFLYENNKSAAQPIKDQISKELGVDLMYINSALVSAQNRQRFYAFNWEVEQPEDRGIVLRDILESGVVDREKSYPLLVSHQGNARDYFKKQHAQIVLEPTRIPEYGVDDKSRPVTASYAYKGDGEGSLVSEAFPDNPNKQVRDYVAEPINIDNIHQLESKENYVQYDLSGKQHNSQDQRAYYVDSKHGKLNASSTQSKTGVIEPIRIGDIGSTAQAHRVYSCDGKSVCLKAQGGGQGAKTGLYATPICHTIPQEVRVRKYTCDIGKFQECLRSHKTMSCRVISEKLDRPQTEVEHWFRTDKYFNIPDEDVWFDLKKLLNIQTTEFDDFVTVFEVREGVFEKADRCYDVNGKMSTLTTGKTDNIIAPSNGKERPIYEVKDGFITIKDKKYPIKLTDGFYIIRKLTVKECCRLQTLPDDYCRAVSNAQAYKGLGNGWTAEVIIHILNGVLKDVPRDEEIVVLSMYDGIGTGRYCLDKMGFTNVRYYAYETDKYAKQMAMSNYPDIIQCGDAFDLRHPDWTIGY